MPPHPLKYTGNHKALDFHTCEHVQKLEDIGRVLWLVENVIVFGDDMERKETKEKLLGNDSFAVSNFELNVEFAKNRL